MGVRRGELLKPYDRYAKQVSLTYLKSGTYRTAAGGACSIFSFLVLVYWLAVNVFYAIYDNGTFDNSSQTKLAQDLQGHYAEYVLNQSEFLITYNLSIMIDGKTSQLPDTKVVGVWAQVNSELVTYYFAQPCKEIFPEGTVSENYFSQIKDETCPDMRGDNVILKDQDSDSTISGFQKFVLIIDTCANLASITGVGADYCDATFDTADLNDVMVVVKRASQLFSSKTFIQNENQLST